MDQFPEDYSTDSKWKEFFSLIFYGIICLALLGPFWSWLFG